MRTRSNQYTDEQRRAAIAAYCTTGTYMGAERATGVPNLTIRYWRLKHPDYWQRVEQEFWDQCGDDLKAAFARGARKGLELIEQRLNSDGEPVFNKDGEIVNYKPIPVRDLVIATGTLFDKLRLLEGKPTSISSKQSEHADIIGRLKQIAIAKSQEVSELDVKRIEHKAEAEAEASSDQSADQDQARG